MKQELLLKKWLDGSISSEELKQLSSDPDFELLQRIDQTAKRFKAPDFDVESALAELREKRTVAPKVIQMSWVQPLLKVAAIFVVMIAGYFTLFYNSTTTVETLATEQELLTLPDASEVTLNSETTITYQKKNWEENRTLNLDGEAFFKVAKGATFSVETTQGIVQVLGTQFNVKTREQYFEVICYEGLVRVTTPTSTLELPAGHSYRLMNDLEGNTSGIQAERPSWMQDLSSFQSVPYIQVVQEMERQYGLTIRLENIDINTLFTGSFTHNDLDVALKSITLPLNITYQTIDDSTVAFSTAK